MPSCFVVVPFHEPFNRYYNEIIAPTIRENGLTPRRGDSFFRPGSIMDDIWQMIRESAVIVAELTKQNANVFYELGLAHAAGKPVILVSETLKDVPFDLRSLRVITYDRKHPEWGNGLRRQLFSAIQETLSDPVGAIPPVFRAPWPRPGHPGDSLNHDNPGFADRVKVLHAMLLERSYPPDLIAGVSRGGLVVAFHLSKLVPDPLVPVISLWPDSRFENPFNRISVERDDVITDAVRARILIVDDIVRSGRTLEDAKSYLAHLARRVDPGAFEIKTAAISYYRKQYARSAPPDFHVDEPADEIRDQAGEVEKITARERP